MEDEVTPYQLAVRIAAHSISAGFSVSSTISFSSGKLGLRDARKFLGNGGRIRYRDTNRREECAMTIPLPSQPLCSWHRKFPVGFGNPADALVCFGIFFMISGAVDLSRHRQI
jgi:hypothetical protein